MILTSSDFFYLHTLQGYYIPERKNKHLESQGFLQNEV